MDKSKFSKLIFFLLLVSDLFLWYQLFSAPALKPGDYFLDVGQGDSELIVLPSGVKILTDAGPTKGTSAAVVQALEKVLPPGDRYIDIAVISHPQSDHYGGFNALLDRYQIGAFIWNGRDDDPSVASWFALKDKIRAKQIPFIVLGAGDNIISGDSTDDFISPNPQFAASGELNETGFVERVVTPQFSTLLTADIDVDVEKYLSRRGPSSGEAEDGPLLEPLRADVVKIAHHGSKYASTDAFLRAVNPKVAAIEVGANNTYGHPASSTLARIANDTTAQIFRTDQAGTIHVFVEEGRLKVETKR